MKLLNDRFGIQTRGGCSCAGTYGHYLLHVDQDMSRELTSEISIGELIRKPGWIRMSIHPTTTTDEIHFVCDSIKAYDKNTNEFIHRSFDAKHMNTKVEDWFTL